MNETMLFLEHQAYTLRVDSVRMTTAAGSGHPTSCLSAADLVAALFFYAMRYNPQNYHYPENDRFILSKGHAAPLLYAAWQLAGVLTQKQLMEYRTIDSPLEGHPTLRFDYTEAATGSLGIGLSIGAGMALASKIYKRPYYTYVLLGDSEASEGSIWEAAEIGAFYKLNNLVAILDCNRLGQSTETMYGHHTQRYVDKFESFGWKAITIDGHDMQQIMSAYDKARETTDRPTIIIAKTVKGYGVESVENKEGYHGKPFKKEELPEILTQLEQRFAKAASFDEDAYCWKPYQFKNSEEKEHLGCNETDFHEPTHEKGELVATRKAYGNALSRLGKVCEQVVSLDGEVKNSTFAELFEDKFPDRFVQCFIAEQNMVAMGVGFDRRGYVPFISTFGAFFSRAADQVRMAAIGMANLRLVGSHAGVSIGQDGPSQMALEDISMMSALPGSIILYPSDAVSTYKLVKTMADYDQGISYLRTTRMETPVRYAPAEEFPIGGCKVLYQSDKDVACVVAAGVTLWEAVKAYDLLQKEGISIAVIDLYCIKPLDAKTVETVAKKSSNQLITVEDHYVQGGIGEKVTYALRNSSIHIDTLAVTKLPRSGKPEELLAWAGIDAAALVAKVRQIKNR